jgi:hypothetical protein
MLDIAMMTRAIMRFLVGSPHPVDEAGLQFRWKFSGKQQHNRMQWHNKSASR